MNKNTNSFIFYLYSYYKKNTGTSKHIYLDFENVHHDYYN